MLPRSRWRTPGTTAARAVVVSLVAVVIAVPLAGPAAATPSDQPGGTTGVLDSRALDRLQQRAAEVQSGLQAQQSEVAAARDAKAKAEAAVAEAESQLTDAESELQHLLSRESTRQGPVLEGARVRIEPIGHERARALLAGRPEPELPWEEGFPPPPLLASLQRVIDDPDGPVWFGPFYAYVIIRRADGLAVGDAGFFGPPGADGEVEIGYALVPRARGSGLAGEAVSLLADWALSQPGVRALTARVEADNAASLRLLDRLGFVPDGRSEPYLRYAFRRTD